MKICTCENCRYTFRSPIRPVYCPDCGREKVRLANKKEIREYHRLQAIVADEIRMGLYAAG